MSTAILEACKSFLPDKRCRILDPFAGVGTTALSLPDHDVVGVEIEREWAECHPSTICGDSLLIVPTLGHFDAVITSPTYGNRMADDFNASDPSRRVTYRHILGRKLSEGTSSNLHFGRKNCKYELLHKKIWKVCVDSLRSGGLFIINCKDFIASKEVQEVSKWHIDTLTNMGLVVEGHLTVPCKGMRFGSNFDSRLPYENVFCLRKP